MKKVTFRIAGWDVSRVTAMNEMLYNLPAFKQDISRWDVSKVNRFDGFLTGSSLPTNVYNQVLIRWSRLPLQPNTEFAGGSSRYDSGLPAECRALMIEKFGCIPAKFTDGGTTGNPYKPPVTVLSVR